MMRRKIDPKTLLPNPWNTNRLTAEAQLKLEESITRLGMFKPVTVRTLPDGTKQILGGQHRAEIAERLGIEVEIFDVGVIGDLKAKEIGLADNARYGYDDSEAMAALMKDFDPVDLASFMPFDLRDAEALAALGKIDLDTLGLDEDDADVVPEKPVRAAKTEVIMKFKIPVDDQGMIERQIKAIMKDQNFVESDSLANAGHALVWLFRHAAAAS